MIFGRYKQRPEPDGKAGTKQGFQPCQSVHPRPLIPGLTGILVIMPCRRESFLWGDRPPSFSGSSTRDHRRIDDPRPPVQFPGEVLPHLGVLAGELHDDADAMRGHGRGHVRQLHHAGRVDVQ